MQTQLTLSGVPKGLAKDGWWLSESAEPSPQPTETERDTWQTKPWQSRGLGLLLLVLIADFLFWSHAPGLSLALFGAAIFGVAACNGASRKKVLQGTAVFVLCALPVIEYLQFLSLLFLVLGTLAAIVIARGASSIPPALLRLGARIPFGGLVALVSLGLRSLEKSEPVQGAPIASATKAALRNWAFPLGGTFVFLSLLLDANPVLSGLLAFEFNIDILINRSLFWGGFALLLWPLVDRGPVEVQGPRATWRFPAERMGINAASVLRALVMFNLLIGVQTVLDLSILIGGADLPEDMSYATYAHRGAYPLLITAILAGAFSLAARPHLASHPALKPLLLLWLAQNIALTASAALRLDLYIDIYGLTYLRVHALIWMALVAAGLGLAIWQVARERSNAWVLRRTGVMSLATLYACCFVNFAGLIVTYNIQSAAEFDVYYACGLGPSAAAALTHVPGSVTHAKDDAPRVEITPNAVVYAPTIWGWRDWGFRNWRVRSYVETASQLEPAP